MIGAIESYKSFHSISTVNIIGSQEHSNISFVILEKIRKVETHYSDISSYFYIKISK